ncbi:MAG: hypothetical protein K6E54_05810 [Bacteroidaceae bacterium]|nr:hypothetical protein [Bacteroidaceae bacterium]
MFTKRYINILKVAICCILCVGCNNWHEPMVRGTIDVCEENIIPIHSVVSLEDVKKCNGYYFCTFDVKPNDSVDNYHTTIAYPILANGDTCRPVPKMDYQLFYFERNDSLMVSKLHNDIHSWFIFDFDSWSWQSADEPSVYDYSYEDEEYSLYRMGHYDNYLNFKNKNTGKEYVYLFKSFKKHENSLDFTVAKYGNVIKRIFRIGESFIIITNCGIYKVSNPQDGKLHEHPNMSKERIEKLHFNNEYRRCASTIPDTLYLVSLKGKMRMLSGYTCDGEIYPICYDGEDLYIGKLDGDSISRYRDLGLYFHVDVQTWMGVRDSSHVLFNAVPKDVENDVDSTSADKKVVISKVFDIVDGTVNIIDVVN